MRRVVGGPTVPETQYVRFGDADIAYQVVGDGPLDLIYCAGVQHLEVQWEHPAIARFLRRLVSGPELAGSGERDSLPSSRVPA